MANICRLSTVLRIQASTSKNERPTDLGPISDFHVGSWEADIDADAR